MSAAKVGWGLFFSWWEALRGKSEIYFIFIKNLYDYQFPPIDISNWE